MPAKRRLTEEKVYAGREDELHEPSGKTTRLSHSTRTARDTDHPERESIRGETKQPQRLKRPKSPIPKPPTTKPAPPAEPKSKPPKATPPAEADGGGDETAVKSSKAERKRLKRKTKAAVREEKKQSHKSSAPSDTVITTPATLTAVKKGSSSQPAIANEKEGGARLEQKIRHALLRRMNLFMLVFPRTKSLVSAEALQRALIERLRTIRVTPRSCVATASNFVWIRLFSTKERNWTLKKLANFKFTLDGTIIAPEIVRYGKLKAGPRVSAYQVTRSITSSTDILIALADHILKVEKTLPGFRVYELLCGEIPVRSLIIQFAVPPPSLGRKVNLLNRPVTHLTNSKCILRKALDHTLWNCPSPPAQVSSGYSIGPILFEFQGQTWDPKLVEGLEELQLDRQRTQANNRGEDAYDSDSDSDIELVDVTLKPGSVDSAEEEESPRTRRKRGNRDAKKGTQGQAALSRFIITDVTSL